MKSNFFASIGFFIFIQLVYIILGGSFELIAAKLIPQISDIQFINYLGFPIAAITIYFIVKRYFTSVSAKCNQWLSYSRTDIFLFPILIVGIFLFLIVITLLGEYSHLVQYKVANGQWITHKIGFSIVVIPFLVALAEEYIYRGVLMAYFIEKFTKVRSIIVLSILFSIMHFDYIGILPFITAFLMGILASLLLFKTGSLFTSIWLHMGWNIGYSILTQYYEVEIKMIPIWGNLFELYQIGLFVFLIFIYFMISRYQKKTS